MELGQPLVLVAAAHPSLDAAVRLFCDDLRAEARSSARRGAPAPEPIPAIVRRLESPDPAIALAAIVDGELIGLARIDEQEPGGPELLIAVTPRWRGRGVATELGSATVARAHAAGVPRIVMRSSRRGTDVQAVGNALGFRVFDLGQGRLDLIRTVAPVTRTA
ncbi:MAG: GNAT family N-acetyltransferase [Ilumatobacteraceae bacterium]